MDYRELCMDIFGTADPEQLNRIAKRAEAYERLYEKQKIANSRHAGRKPKVKEDEAKVMWAMYESGAGIGQIAQHFHVSRPTVYKYISAKRRWEEDDFVKIRMDFMYDDELCSVIDVDFRNQKVYVENKTDEIILTAFGVNKNPDWETFNEFLESRCIPRTRCQIKEILRENDMDFYEPLQIIEKTQGRMAEDHHWIRIHYKDEKEGEM